MPESLESVLVGATQAALEKTAFMFAEPGTPEAADIGQVPPPVVATVAFTGSHHGAFAIAFPARLLPVLAVNVLGEEDAPDDETQRDALGELANIICGNVLPALNPEGKYSLGPPAVGGSSARGLLRFGPRRTGRHAGRGREDRSVAVAQRARHAGRACMIRVLVVDDSAVVRKVLTEELSRYEDIEVVAAPWIPTWRARRSCACGRT